jgi:ribulose-phosphate 3-epimerase
MAHMISPSILNTDFSKLPHTIEIINESEADYVHLDVMDGLFVPNITFGFQFIESIKRLAKKPLDVHLMIVEPDRFINEFHKSGADILTVHYEACRHLHRAIQSIHTLGMKAGVSLNPHSPVHLLEEIIQDIDLVLIMTVNPGFGGQQFIPNSYKKVRELKTLITKTRSRALIEVDGGVDLEKAPKLLEAGVDILVAGSYIFGAQDPVLAISQLKSILPAS